MGSAVRRETTRGSNKQLLLVPYRPLARISRTQPEMPIIARQALLQATGPRQDEVPSVARAALERRDRSRGA